MYINEIKLLHYVYIYRAIVIRLLVYKQIMYEITFYVYYNYYYYYLYFTVITNYCTLSRYSCKWYIKGMLVFAISNKIKYICESNIIFLNVLFTQLQFLIIKFSGKGEHACNIILYQSESGWFDDHVDQTHWALTLMSMNKVYIILYYI